MADTPGTQGIERMGSLFAFFRIRHSRAAQHAQAIQLSPTQGAQGHVKGQKTGLRTLISPGVRHTP